MLLAGTPVCFDTETTGLHPRKNKLVALQFKQEGRPAGIVDMRDVSAASFKSLLQRLFDGVLIVGMNLKFDAAFTFHHTGARIPTVYDIQLAEQVLYGVGTSDARKIGIPLDMKSIAERYGLPVSKEERSWFIDLDDRQDEWDAEFPVEQCIYMAQDVAIPLAVRLKQLPILSSRGLMDAASMEMSLSPAISWVERNGVPVNVAEWRAVIAAVQVQEQRAADKAGAVFGAAILEARAQEFDLKKEQYDAWCQVRDLYLEAARTLWESDSALRGEYQGAWGKYKTEAMSAWRYLNPNPGSPKMPTDLPNINSHAQLVRAFELMGIRRPDRNGNMAVLSSTAADVVEEWVTEFPQLALLTEHSKLEKMVTAFGEAVLKYYSPDTGRIYPTLDQYGASTRRMSCRAPNWQQVPSRSDTGKQLRSCVQARQGWQILTADYSSIEPRVLADLSGDPVLLDLFARGADVYKETAKQVLGLCSVDVVTKDQRNLFKTIMLGLSYGMEAGALAKRVDISRREAQGHIDGFFTMYAGVRQYLNGCKLQVHRTHESVTLVGGKRFYRFPQPPRSEVARKEYKYEISKIERRAMNTPMQGGSADITKQAVINFYQAVRGASAMEKIQLIAVVHDELVVEARTEVADLAAHLLSQAMDQAAKHFLHRVYVPAPEVVTGAYWKKD